MSRATDTMNGLVAAICALTEERPVQMREERTFEEGSNAKFVLTVAVGDQLFQVRRLEPSATFVCFRGVTKIEDSLQEEMRSELLERVKRYYEPVAVERRVIAAQDRAAREEKRDDR